MVVRKCIRVHRTRSTCRGRHTCTAPVMMLFTCPTLLSLSHLHLGGVAVTQVSWSHLVATPPREKLPVHRVPYQQREPGISDSSGLIANEFLC